MSQLQEKAPEPDAVVHLPVDSVVTGPESGAPQSPVPLSPLAGVAGKRRREKTPKKAPPEPTPEQVAAQEAHGSARAAWVKHRAGGRNDAGTFNDNVAESPVRTRAGERLPQLVKHVSEVILSLAKGAEIEAMWVRDTLVIAGNDASQADGLVTRVAKAVDNPEIAADKGMLRQLLALAAPDAPTRVAKTVAKLENIKAGVRGKGWDAADEDAADLAEHRALQEVLKRHALPDTVMDMEEATAALTARTHGVIFLHESPIHAEQQLVRLLSLSPFPGERATIRGTKRPCYGCYLALTYAQRFQGCVGLDHGVRPGGLWLNSVDSALEHIKALPGSKGTAVQAMRWADEQIKAFDTTRQHKSRLKSGKVVSNEDSESDSEADDDL